MKITKWGFFNQLILGVLCFFSVDILFAQSEIDIGFDSGAFHDSNPALYPDSFESLTESIGFMFKPFINLHLSTLSNDLKFSSDYCEERFNEKMVPQAFSGYSLSIDWTHKINEALSFNILNDFKHSTIDREAIDIPEYRGKTRDNKLLPGIIFQFNDTFKFETRGVWKLKKYIDSEPDPFTERHFNENWDEYGASTAFHYYPIKEIGFFINLSHLKKKFRRFDPVPGQIRSDGSFGFQTLLPYGTEIKVQASIYVFEFKGEVPRRMKAEYTDFGIQLDINQSFSSDWSMNFKAESIYDVSERGPRYFFHLENISARIEYQGDKPPVFNAYVRYSKLDYLGQEPHFVDYETLAGLSAGYKISNYVAINGFYNYFKRTQYSSEFDTEANRFGLELKLRFHSPVGR
ncbi:MAG: hypothetical protein WBM02_03605 [bacterium]